MSVFRSQDLHQLYIAAGTPTKDLKEFIDRYNNGTRWQKIWMFAVQPLDMDARLEASEQMIRARDNPRSLLAATTDCALRVYAEMSGLELRTVNYISETPELPRLQKREYTPIR
jgi:hypothetical protein